MSKHQIEKKLLEEWKVVNEQSWGGYLGIRSKDGIIGFSSTRFVGLIRAEENAKLMAAGPALYNALENLIWQVSNNVPWAQIEAAIKDGRKALNKAKAS